MISHAWVQLMGGPSAKVVFCQCWWTDIQGISTLFPGGSICQSIVLCQCWWTGIQGISTLLLGGPSAKVYLSAKFYLLVVKAYMLYICPAISRMNCIFHQICLWYVWTYICIFVIFLIFSYLFICDFHMQHISFVPFFSTFWENFE